MGCFYDEDKPYNRNFANNKASKYNFEQFRQMKLDLVLYTDSLPSCFGQTTAMGLPLILGGLYRHG